MDFLINIAEHFTGLFQAGADQFTSFVGGMIPLIACLILFVNALIQFIGEDRVWLKSNKFYVGSILQRL